MRRTSKYFVALLPLVTAVLVACDRNQPASTPAETAEAPAAPAPAAEPVEPRAFTFMIDAHEAFALRDGAGSFPNDNKVFGVGRTRDEVNDVLAAAGLPTDTLKLQVQPLLVKAGDRVLLFDAGAGSSMGPDAGHLVEALSEAGVTADAVTDVFISHLHGDHVYGLTNVAGTAVFPNANVHMSRAEWNALRALTPEQATGYGIPQLPSLLSAVSTKVKTFAPGAELVRGVVRAVDIQGHTPGHWAI